MRDDPLKNLKIYHKGKLLPENMTVLYPLVTETMQMVAVSKQWRLEVPGRSHNVVAVDFGGKPSKT